MFPLLQRRVPSLRSPGLHAASEFVLTNECKKSLPTFPYLHPKRLLLQWVRKRRTYSAKEGSATNSKQRTNALSFAHQELSDGGDQVYRTWQSTNRERIAEPALLATAKRAHGPSPTPRACDDFFLRQCLNQ